MKIAIIGIGEVGSCITRALANTDHELILYDKNPSESALSVSRSLNIPLHQSLGKEISNCELILSCVFGSVASDLAHELLTRFDVSGCYLDLTTSSPDEKRRACSNLIQRGLTYLDIAIMGPVAVHGIAVPLLVSSSASNSDADVAINLLRSVGADVRYLERGSPGDSVALKLVRSILTKGLEALSIECLLCAEQFGLRDVLLDQLGDLDQIKMADLMTMLVTSHIRHCARRYHEVEDAISQLRKAGISPRVMTGVHQVFHATSNSSVAQRARFADLDISESLALLHGLGSG